MKAEFEALVIGKSSYDWEAEDGTKGTTYYVEVTQGEGSMRVKCAQDVQESVEKMQEYVFFALFYTRSKARGGGYDFRIESVINAKH